MPLSRTVTPYDQTTRPGQPDRQSEAPPDFHAKAEKAVAGKVPVKRNRFITLAGGAKSVNRGLEAKARGLAGLKGYTTNITNPSPEFVIGAYHQGASSSRSGCPSMTWRPGRSTGTN
jgi:hypothetical protein